MGIFKKRLLWGFGMTIQDIRTIDKELIIKEILVDFFKKEETEQFMIDFMDHLQQDFMRVTDDFAKFVERRYDLINSVPEFDFMDALQGLLNGFYSLKESYLKQHYEMLMSSSKEAKK